MRALAFLPLLALLIALPERASAKDDDDASLVAAPVVDAPVSTGPRLVTFEAAGRAGYVSTPIRGGVNPFGVGFGARLGLEIGRVYVGAGVMDYLGGSDGGATDQALLVGVEAGYSFRLGTHLTLRPQLGLGDTILTHSEPTTTTTVDVVTSASGGGGGGGGGGATVTEVKNVYVEPALTAMLEWGHFFAALRGGALVLPGILYGPAPAQETTWISYSLEAQLGFHL